MELKKYKLSKICTILPGGTPSTSIPEYWNGDIPWLSVKDFANDNKWVSEAEKSITQIGLAHCPASLLKKGDVILSARGTVGKVAMVKREMAFNQSCFGLRAKTDLVTQDFLYYWFINNQQIFKSAQQGNVFKSVTLDFFENTIASIPCVSTQRNICAILSALDDKIALNRAINQNLEALAKQLYDYWFVQFDFPNEEGKPYKSSGGKMVWNEKLKREIPVNWEVSNLGSIVSAYQQGVIRSNNQLSDIGNYGYLKMGDLNGNGQYSLSKLARTDATEEEINLYSLHKGDFLINVRNSKEIVGKTCLINYIERNTLYNHMLVRMSFKKVSSFYMNMLFNTEYMRRIVDGLKQGTTTVIALYQDDLYRLPILVPSQDIMKCFSAITKTILDKQEVLFSELYSLTKQRDELLPLLMNGQVTIE